MSDCQRYLYPGISYNINIFNTLRSRQNGRRFPDNIFKCIFLNENVLILIKVSLKFVPKGPITDIPSFVQIMAWRRSGDKPLFEPMMVSLLTHICITRPQWVNPYDAIKSQYIGPNFIRCYLLINMQKYKYSWQIKMPGLLTVYI